MMAYAGKHALLTPTQTIDSSSIFFLIFNSEIGSISGTIWVLLKEGESVTNGPANLGVNNFEPYPSFLCG